MLNRLTDSLNFQTEALKLRAQRQEILASNIANADTPRYQAREMDFAKALREATGVPPAPGEIGAATAAAPPQCQAATAPGHLSVKFGTLGSEGGALAYAIPSQTSLDGNSVDMDRERAAFADNSVKYEATLRFINGSVRTMLDAIKGQ
ncbi:flagellar basal body rod protein FlgB [Azohydromonas aeria]|uniref:flagellar basal body rod protein FlgB n=1 Tax=Azohydromonas aeria TaxID=2590212 RepID=UPI0012F9A38B|nr:flagellar basal body rod protein FlgB [Azohydromonas aeria]